MNRNIFFSILLILCLSGLIAVIVMISQYKPLESTHIVYEGIPQNNYAEEFSINNFSYAHIEIGHFYKYYSFNVKVEEKEGAPFLNKKTVDTCNLQIGDTFSVGDILGQSDKQDVICEYEGVVLDIQKKESAYEVIVTNSNALIFSYEFTQDVSYLVSYDMQIEVDLGNGDFVPATVNHINYLGMQDAKLEVFFNIRESKTRLFPGYTISARILQEDMGNLFFVPIDFFESYNAISNKAFEVYYISDISEEIDLLTIQTGEVYDDKIIVYGDSITEDMTIYIKQEI